MRDLAVVLFMIGAAVYALYKPWTGVLSLAVLSYLNPHRYAFGFSMSMPVYLVVFSATMIGIFFNGRDRQPFPFTRETFLFLALIGWFTVTTFFGADFPEDARQQWIKVIKVYLSIFPTFWMINNRERLHWLIVAIALSFGLIGLKGGIFALGTGFQYRVWGPDNTFYGGNNEIAMALNMVLPLLLLCAKETSNTLVRNFYYATFFFCICSVISSWSRGGLLGLCVVLGATIMTGRRKWLSVPLVVAALFLAVPNLPTDWFERMGTIKTYEEDQSAMGRLDVWGYAIRRAAENPLTGGGFETFYKGHGLDVHSSYFEILGEHGYVAFGLWLSLLFGTIVALERLRRQVLFHDELAWVRDYARAVQIGLLGYATCGAFLGAAYWDVFYHFVALCVVMKVIARRKIESAEEGAFARNLGFDTPK